MRRALLLLGFVLGLAGSIRADAAAAPCVFCEIVAGRVPAAIIYRDELVVAFLDHAPRNPGHVLVVPVVHADDILTTPPATAERMMVVAQRIARAIERAGLDAEGFNFVVNTGAAAGQTVFHTHLHIMPRHVGDDGLSAPRVKVELAELEPVAAKIRAALAAESTVTE